MENHRMLRKLEELMRKMRN